MAICWKTRGCDPEMQGRCPHNAPGAPCPADCHFAACHRETHDPVAPLDALMNPEVDREAAVKECCLVCRFFLTNGPLLSERD